MNVTGVQSNTQKTEKKMSSLNIICGKAIENSVTLLKILITL